MTQPGISRSLRHFLVDLSYSEGDEFCRNLLQTGEFGQRLLKQMGAKGRTKADLAADLTFKIYAADTSLNIDLNRLLLDFCKQPRQWLFVGRFSGRPNFAKQRSAGEFLHRFGGAEDWYGPFGAGSARWYVYGLRVAHFAVFGENEDPRRLRIRWHVAAEIGKDYCALHWNGFSRTDVKDKAGHPSMFEYWEHIELILEQLYEFLGIDGEFPDLHSLVLHTLLDKFGEVAGYKWRHLKIRALRAGIALNASTGSGVHEQKLTGLDVLTKALASAAVGAIETKPTADKVRLAQGAILRMLLHNWGTKAYEFSLDEGVFVDHDDTEEDEGDDDFDNESAEYVVKKPKIGQMFLGFCYFGNARRGSEKTQEGFPHVRTHFTRGGSTTALAFLLKYLP